MRQLAFMLALSIVTPLAGRAAAEDQTTTRKEDSTRATGKDVNAEPKPTPKAVPEPVPTGGQSKPPGETSKEAPKPEAAKEPGFVDRDGDGIQDGKEHRFRGRHRQQKQKGNLEDGTQQRQQRGPQGPQRQEGQQPTQGRQNGRQGS